MKKTTAFDTTFCATKECSKCTNEFCHYSEEDYAADYEKYDRNTPAYEEEDTTTYEYWNQH